MSMREHIPARKNFAADKRCHWFDDNGRPYKRLDGGLGCPRRDRCYFAHPTEIEIWRNARAGGEPPLHHLTDDEYRLIVGRNRSPGAPRGYPPRAPPRPRSVSPGRRRSPLRRPSREREPPPLASRIRGRSASREREARRLAPRDERSRSPGRARMHRTTPPPPRGPRMSVGGMPPEGPRAAMGAHRSPVIFPKVEPDVAMRDAMRAGYAREDSVASSHHHAQQHTPSGPPLTPAGPSTTATAPARTRVTAPTNAPLVPTPAPSSGSAPAQPDAIKDLLESSTLQWQQISTAVAAASSVTPAKAKISTPTSASSEPLVEDRAKIWSKRIELLASATRIHNECRSMENDVRDYKQLVESFSYQSLPAEDRTVIEGHLHTLQSQLAEKSEEMKKLLTQLANAKFWLTYSDKSKEGGQEVPKEVQGLKASVSQLQVLFQTVATRWEQVGKSLQGNRLSGISNHSVNIPGSSQGVGQSNALIAEAIMPKELDKIRNAITSFEERLASLENKTAHSNDIMPEEFDAIVAENVQALMLAATGTVQAAPPPPRTANTLTANQLKMLETLQQNAAVTAQQVQQLSQKVTEMAGENELLQGENMSLRAENAQLRQQLEQSMVVQLPSGSDSAKLDQMQTEMRALNAAVVAYLAQRPSSTPSLPSADALTEQIVPQIMASLPRVLVPELQGLRDQVQEILRRQQAEFLKELSSHMSTTLQQSVEAIRGVMGQMRPSASAEASGSPSSTNGVGDATST